VSRSSREPFGVELNVQRYSVLEWFISCENIRRIDVPLIMFGGRRTVPYLDERHFLIKILWGATVKVLRLYRSYYKSKLLTVLAI
jgi:hypothetical protein